MKIGIGIGIDKQSTFAEIPLSAPVNVGQPFLTGVGAVGISVICNEGSWSGSPTPTYTYDFRLDSVSVQNSPINSYTPLLADDGKTLTCLVTATNSQGSASEGTSNSLVIGIAPSNTIAPVVSGSTSFGSTLTTTDGTWLGTAPIIYTYQWKRNGVDITGEIANTYVIGSSDSLASITCEVKGTNAYGFDTEISNTITVDNFAPVNTVAPTLSPSGTQSTGTVITVGNGTFAGTAPLTYAYGWKRNGSIILGETTNTYTLVAGDDGTVITAEVKATNAYGESAYIGTSNQVDAVNAVAPSNVTAPVISGSALLGSVLSTTNGTWSGVPATFSYTYQWKRNGSAIVGATASTYTTVVADSTASITCDVTADNGVAPTATAGSNTLTMANYTPANTVAPSVTGNAVVGQTLTTTNGTWTNSPSTFTYQWRRNGVDIGGATASTYTLVSADAGANIKCTVTASNGLSASADSNTLAILATLLDIYPNAGAAYSLRLLRGAYLGSSAIRVRRSNDNAELNIGFTASGNLDTTALTTFVGSNSGFIVTWYDQSGNTRNATELNPALQPRIVNAGTIELLNGKPALNTLGTSRLVVPTSTAAFNYLHNGSNYSVLKVLSSIDTLSNRILFTNTSGSNNTIGMWNAFTPSNRLFIYVPNGANADFSLNSNNNYYSALQGIFLDTNNSQVVTINKNGTQLQQVTNSTTPVTTNPSLDFTLFALPSNTNNTNSLVQELVFYPSSISTAAQTTTNSYYGAY